MSDSESHSSEVETPVNLLPIAKPLATDKIAKKLNSLIKAATEEKVIKRGIKDTMKATKKEKDAKKMKEWICVLAGDVTPLDVISHIPSYMAEKGIACIYVKSRAELGEVCGSKHPTTCLLITPEESSKCYKESHKLVKKIKDLKDD